MSTLYCSMHMVHYGLGTMCPECRREQAHEAQQELIELQRESQPRKQLHLFPECFVRGPVTPDVRRVYFVGVISRTSPGLKRSIASRICGMLFFDPRPTRSHEHENA